jgi:excisionase family DNA binding protein
MTHYFGEEREPMATQQAYTTGQAARLLCVAPRTVCKWFDQGRLRGYRVPGSQDRRIPREQLIAFIAEHSLAVPAELTHPDGCSCGSPDCPQYQADAQGVARE